MSTELKKHEEVCFAQNIKPLQESLLEILETQKGIKKKLDEAMPTIREINDVKKAWGIAGIVGSTLVKIIVSTGIIITAGYSLREWFKK